MPTVMCVVQRLFVLHCCVVHNIKLQSNAMGQVQCSLLGPVQCSVLGPVQCSVLGTCPGTCLWAPVGEYTVAVNQGREMGKILDRSKTGK